MDNTERPPQRDKRLSRAGESLRDVVKKAVVRRSFQMSSMMRSIAKYVSMVILLSALGSGQTWRFVQDMIQTSCANSTTSCNVQAIAPPTAGSVWIVLLHSGNNVTITSASDNQGSPGWTHCPNCHILGNTNVDMIYTTQGRAGVTSITVNTSGSTGSPTEFDFIEFLPPAGATASFEASGGVSSSCPSGVCTGVNLGTLAGTDLVFQALHGNDTSWRGWSSPYITDYNADGIGLNMTSGAAPTVTVASGSATISAIAFTSTAGSFAPPTAQFHAVQFVPVTSGAGCQNCTITLTQPTGAGNLLYLSEGGDNGEYITSVCSNVPGQGCVSTGWTVPSATNGTSCRFTDGNSSHPFSCAYNLSAPSGATSITATLNANVPAFFSIWEISANGGAFSLDAMASTSAKQSNGGGTNVGLTGQPLTVSASNDVVFQSYWAAGGANGTSNYPLPKTPGDGVEFYISGGAGTAVLENTFSSTVPVPVHMYTGTAGVGAVAFKATSASGTVQPPTNLRVVVQ